MKEFGPGKVSKKGLIRRISLVTAVNSSKLNFLLNLTQTDERVKSYDPPKSLHYFFFFLFFSFLLFSSFFFKFQPMEILASLFMTNIFPHNY